MKNKVKVRCLNCLGHGVIDVKEKKCPRCKGTGIEPSKGSSAGLYREKKMGNKIDIITPETDSRTQKIESYFKDVKSGNQPCKTVVPSSWAKKLEVRVRKLEEIIKELNNENQS